MKVKFIGYPFLHVIDYRRCKEVFCFPESGIYETDDEKLIAWMKKNKPHIGYEEVPEAVKPKKVNKPKKPTE